MGVDVDELDDGLVIAVRPQPATIQTYDDHRMAMSFAIAAHTGPGTPIADPGCVAKTVPGFWRLLFPCLGRTGHRLGRAACSGGWSRLAHRTGASQATRLMRLSR